jgi:hypothetical protein
VASEVAAWVWEVEPSSAAERLILRPLQQLRHLGHVDGDAPRLLARQQIGGGSTTRLVLIVQVCERLPAVIADDKARPVALNLPRRREATSGMVHDRTYHERAQGWRPGRGNRSDSQRPTA